MKTVIYLCCIVLCLCSCNEPKAKLPENFDYGNTSNGLYTNSYFNLEVEFNPHWTLQNKQQIDDLIELHTKTSGKDANFKAIIEASQIHTAYLLTIFKYDMGSAVAFNPSFMVIAENLNNFSGIKNGKDYLFHAKKLMQNTEMQYSFKTPVKERNIGTAQCYVMETQLDLGGTTIVQEYMSTVRKGFSLSFVLTYATTEERDALYAIIGSIKM